MYRSTPTQRRYLPLLCKISLFFVTTLGVSHTGWPLDTTLRNVETGGEPPAGRESFTGDENPNNQAIEGVTLKLSTWPDLVSVDLTNTNQDIWYSIRRGFSIPDLSSAGIRNRQAQMLKNKQALKAMLKRSEPYLYHIAQECEKRNLPTELALLPFIESEFNPHARSRAAAVGLWQFIPSTGKHFDLKQNEWVDERQDLVASTRAALDYLTNLYDMYGDWHLALISYNWGEGSVARAIQKAKDAGREPTLENLDLPAETAAYIPKLQALKNIINDPDKYDLQMPVVPNEPYFVEIKRKTDLDLREVSRLSGIRLEEFRQLNPGLKKPVLYAAQTRSLLVPADKADLVRESLSTYKAPKLKAYSNYQVKKGDTLISIAQKLKVSTKTLMASNGLTKRSTLRPGMTLNIPNVEDARSWNGRNS